MSSGRVLVTFSPSSAERRAIEEALRGAASVGYLADAGPDGRARVLASADCVLAWNLARELDGSEEYDLLASIGLLQLLSAGVDHVPFDRIPDAVTVASNAGAYADPMAEHVVAMALALAKRLPQNHAALARGEFDQHTLNLAIRGSVAGILGFGGIGQASAELLRGMGARIRAINRSGETDREVEAIAPLDGLDRLLAAADILVISLPLTRQTDGLIGARELSLLKPSAILVNVARAAIIEEDALYEHLRSNPGFSAGLDVWWQEPFAGGAFATHRPFLELPNVLGSPHNSGLTPGALVEGARRAAANIARHLRGEPVGGVIDRRDYVD